MTDARAGFSLLEALVALAVTSLVLMLLATVATRSARQGFHLSGRALEASDAQVGAASVRALLHGVRTPVDAKGWEDAFEGRPEALSASVLADRATPCGPAGPSKQLRLWLQRVQDHVHLLCGTPDAPQSAALLLDLGPGPAGFLYAGTDGRWRDRLSFARPATSAGPGTRPRRLWLRLWSARLDLIEAAGRPPGVQG